MVPDPPDDMRRSVMTAMPSISDEDIELCIEETAPKVMCPFQVLCVKSLVICTLHMNYFCIIVKSFTYTNLFQHYFPMPS